MVSASVAQNETTPITDGKKPPQNAPPWSVAVPASIGTTPPAAVIPQANSATAARPSVGAANAASRPIACGPRIATPTLSSQNRPNATYWCGPIVAHAGNSRETIASSASPPNHELIPNQPAPITARASAGTCAPRVPNHSRANTG